VLRVNASDKAVGAALYQECPDEFGVVHEPIGFSSIYRFSLKCLEVGGVYGLLRSEFLCLLSAGKIVSLSGRSSKSTVDREVRRAKRHEVAGIPTVIHRTRLGGEKYCRRLAFYDACLSFLGDDIGRLSAGHSDVVCLIGSMLEYPA